MSDIEAMLIRAQEAWNKMTPEQRKANRKHEIGR